MKDSLIKKYNRKLKRVVEQRKFYNSSAEHNASAGRDTVARELKVKAEYYERKEKLLIEFINDLKSL